MSRFKFRAWDDQGSKSKMHYPGDKTIDDTALILNFHGDVLEARKLHKGNATPQAAYEHSVYPARIGHNMRLMQCTGVSDKNGKDIYEGDILSGWDGVRPSAVVVAWFEGNAEYILVDVDEWRRGNYEEPNYIAQDQPWTEREVLGNIHENPELLK